MTRSLAATWMLVLGLFITGSSGCGGGGQTTPPPEAAVEPVGQAMQATGLEVEIFTSVERILVQGFRIDFPKMKNVTQLVGFVPDQWDRIVRVPLDSLQEFQIRGGIDSGTFDRIYANREQFDVEQDQFFNVTMVALDGNRSDLIVMLPKFRGLKDGIVWELSMAGNPARVDRVIIRP